MKKVPVQVEGRDLVLSNLDKVLYPEAGFTKAEVIDYYSRISGVLLPHLRGRPLTVKRYPNGVGGAFFFEKNAPRHTPSWIRTVTPAGPRQHEEPRDHRLPRRRRPAHAGLLREPGGAGAPRAACGGFRTTGEALPPDLLVFDLRPRRARLTIVECCEVALLLREVLAEDGHECFAKTSGNKGMQLHVPWDSAESTSAVREGRRRTARRETRLHHRRDG